MKTYDCRLPSVVLNSVNVVDPPAGLSVAEYAGGVEEGPFDWKVRPAVNDAMLRLLLTRFATLAARSPRQLLRPFTNHETVTFEAEVIRRVSSDHLTGEISKALLEAGSKEGTEPRGAKRRAMNAIFVHAS